MAHTRTWANLAKAWCLPGVCWSLLKVANSTTSIEQRWITQRKLSIPWLQWKLNIIHVKMVHVGCWQANEQTAHCSGNAIYTRNSFIYLSDKWCGKKFHIFPLLGALSVQKRYGLCMSKIYAFFCRKNTIFTALSSECDRLLWKEMRMKFEIGPVSI